MALYEFEQNAEDYRRIEKAIQFIEENFTRRPDLDAMAKSVNLSRFHFNRLFKRWAGISPMQFMKFLTLDYTKDVLTKPRSVLDAALDAGLSGPGRLHDLFVTFEAMTPGEFKAMGRGLTIDYGFFPSPFGQCLLALTDRGICHFGFVDENNRDNAVNMLISTWPGAVYTENPSKTSSVVKQIFSQKGLNNERPFHLLLKGTNFQINVWKALLAIPEGRMVSYEDVASYIGRPKAIRAVAGACAVNPVGYLIPCHRVIAKNGNIHKYRWGSVRKKALVGWEAAKTV